MNSRIYIGLLEFKPGVIPKLNQKHHITEDEVRANLQYPAQVDAGHEDHPEHGSRWIALVHVGDKSLFAALDPLPFWEGENAETWEVRTAYWLE